MKTKVLITLVFISLLAACGRSGENEPLIAEDDPILLTVDGAAISIPMLEFLMRARGIGNDDIDGMRALLDELIKLRAVANAAQREGVADAPALRAERLVRDLERVQLAYFTHIYEQHPVTEAQIQGVYNAQLERSGRQQYQLSLVAYPDQLNALRALAEIELGQQPFAAAEGQNLSSQWVDRSQLPSSLAALSDGFEVGMVLPEPLPGASGWQLAQVTDMRAFEPPPLAEVRDGIERMLVRQRLEALVDDLYEAADIVPQLPLNQTLGAGGDAPQP
jgi:parvulin-like peptidyl-prolyl isomerase